MDIKAYHGWFGPVESRKEIGSGRDDQVRERRYVRLRCKHPLNGVLAQKCPSRAEMDLLRPNRAFGPRMGHMPHAQSVLPQPPLGEPAH